MLKLMDIRFLHTTALILTAGAVILASVMSGTVSAAITNTKDSVDFNLKNWEGDVVPSPIYGNIDDWSVDGSGNYAIVGTGFADAAYVFAVTGDCNGNAITDACEILDGAATDVNHSGILDSCENIPAVSRWGLFVLTLLLAVAGTVCLQRRAPSRCVLNQRG